MQKLFEETGLMGKRWNSMNIVFTINMFQKTSKGEIFSFWWKLPKSCYSEYISRNLYLWTGVLSTYLPFVGSGGQRVLLLSWCNCLKTSSWAKPRIHLDIISTKPKLWSPGRCGASPRRRELRPEPLSTADSGGPSAGWEGSTPPGVPTCSKMPL